jgi:hypothetical protein
LFTLHAYSVGCRDSHAVSLRSVRAKEKIDDDDVTESDFMRDLLDRGLRDRDRRVQLFLRLDLPNRVAAQMENDRDRGESDEAVIRRFLTEAVEAREADTLEKVGIDEDDALRALVEREQNPGEPLDDVVRRLVRAGAEQTQDARLRRLGGSWAGRVVLTDTAFNRDGGNPTPRRPL